MIVEWVKFVRYSCDISFEWKKYLIASFPVSESTVTRLFLIFFPKSQMQPVLNICLNFTPLQKRIVYSICQRRTRRNGFHYPLQFFLAFEKISVSAFRSLRSTYGYRLLYSTQGFFWEYNCLRKASCPQSGFILNTILEWAIKNPAIFKILMEQKFCG